MQTHRAHVRILCINYACAQRKNMVARLVYGHTSVVDKQ